jgi:hypothetical protein
MRIPARAGRSDANNARTRLCVGTADHAEGHRVFDCLAAGGTITIVNTG